MLVSNNPYAADRPLVRGTRPAPDSGQLGIIVLDAPGDSPRVPARAWSSVRLEINAPAAVHAGIDGEAVDLELLLRFASRPASLRVRIPPPPERLALSASPPSGPPTRVMAHLPGTAVADGALSAHPELDACPSC